MTSASMATSSVQNSVYILYDWMNAWKKHENGLHYQSTEAAHFDTTDYHVSLHTSYMHVSLYGKLTI